ncbi:hypothetical protein ABBQ38_003816 [Trebouxia sp. C0009 RCD-2024]
MDYTALVASTQELKTYWIPAKVAQGDTWLYLSWHPVSGRICTGPQPARGTAAEAFSFGEQVEATIKQLVLLDAVVPQPWERVVQLSFGVRPATPPTHHIFLEVMGRYSNVILARPDGEILLCAYQVGSKMSSARQLQTGGRYQLPPKPQGIPPDLAESFDSWKHNVCQAAQMVSTKSSKTASVADGMVRAYQVHVCRSHHELYPIVVHEDSPRMVGTGGQPSFEQGAVCLGKRSSSSARIYGCTRLASPL